MVSLSIMAALGALFCWGFGDFFIQRATRKMGDVESLAWIGFIGAVCMLPFVWHDLSLLLQRSNLSILFVLGLITFTVGIINFEAFRRGKLSVIEVLLELELPVTVLFSIFFLGEHINAIQTVLAIIIFSGIILIAARPGEIKKHHFFEKGAVLAIIAAGGYGLINFLTTVGARQISPLLAIWFPWLTFTIICALWLMAKGRLRPAAAHAKTYWKLILAIGLFDTLAWIFFAFALQKKELAVIIAITESFPAVSLMLGIKVNKEKVAPHQLAGAITTIVASFLMGLFA